MDKGWLRAGWRPGAWLRPDDPDAAGKRASRCLRGEDARGQSAPSGIRTAPSSRVLLDDVSSRNRPAGGREVGVTLTVLAADGWTAARSACHADRAIGGPPPRAAHRGEAQRGARLVRWHARAALIGLPSRRPGRRPRTRAEASVALYAPRRCGDRRHGDGSARPRVVADRGWGTFEWTENLWARPATIAGGHREIQRNLASGARPARDRRDDHAGGAGRRAFPGSRRAPGDTGGGTRADVQVTGRESRYVVKACRRGQPVGRNAAAPAGCSCAGRSRCRDGGRRGDGGSPLFAMIRHGAAVDPCSQHDRLPRSKGGMLAPPGAATVARHRRRAPLASGTARRGRRLRQWSRTMRAVRTTAPRVGGVDVLSAAPSERPSTGARDGDCRLGNALCGASGGGGAHWEIYRATPHGHRWFRC